MVKQNSRIGNTDVPCRQDKNGIRVSVLLRTSRAKVGVEKTATAITTFVMPLPRIATMAIARISPGKANRTSQILIIIESIHPP